MRLIKFFHYLFISVIKFFSRLKSVIITRRYSINNVVDVIWIMFKCRMSRYSETWSVSCCFHIYRKTSASNNDSLSNLSKHRTFSPWFSRFHSRTWTAINFAMWQHRQQVQNLASMMMMTYWVCLLIEIELGLWIWNEVAHNWDLWLKLDWRHWKQKKKNFFHELAWAKSTLAQRNAQGQKWLRSMRGNLRMFHCRRWRRRISAIQSKAMSKRIKIKQKITKTSNLVVKLLKLEVLFQNNCAIKTSLIHLTHHNLVIRHHRQLFTHSVSHCKSSASQLVPATPSVVEAWILVLPRALSTVAVFRLLLLLRHHEPLALSEISTFVPSQPTIGVENRFVAAVLKPWPLIRQHLAYQAPAKREKKRENENPDR